MISGGRGWIVLSYGAHLFTRLQQTLVLGVAGALLLGLIGCGTEQERIDAAGAPRAGAPAHIPWQAQEYRLFRTSPEVPPPAIRDALGSAFTPNWGAAQLVPGPKDGHYWLVPDHQRICMLANAHGTLASTCARRNVASKHGIAIVLISPRSLEPLLPRRSIVGVAPNGITNVQLHDPAHLTTALRVSRAGVFELSGPSTNPPRLITVDR